MFMIHGGSQALTQLLGGGPHLFLGASGRIPKEILEQILPLSGNWKSTIMDVLCCWQKSTFTGDTVGDVPLQRLISGGPWPSRHETLRASHQRLAPKPPVVYQWSNQGLNNLKQLGNMGHIAS